VVGIELTSRVVASPDQVSCDIAGETVVLNLRDGVYYGLDSVGTRIWTLITDPLTVEEIRETLVAEYDVDSAECERQVLRLLGELLEHGLIEVDAGPSA
jgi:hypothetical protein